MQVTYYPGCSLEGSAREYDESIRETCRVLDITLNELTDWSCCGANAAAGYSEELGVQLAVRNLVIAQQSGEDLLIPCVGCYNRFRSAARLAGEEPSLVDGMGYKGGVPLVSPLDLFLQEEVAARLSQSIVKPLEGLKLVCYYGCVIVRPPKLTGVKEYENPMVLDNLMRTVGAETIDWPLKTDCCGSDLGIARIDIMKTLVGALLNMASDVGADAIAVACPLCHSNLDTRQDEIVAQGLGKTTMPVFYFSELIALALGIPRAGDWWNMHMVSPEPLLSRLNLL